MVTVSYRFLPVNLLLFACSASVFHLMEQATVEHRDGLSRNSQRLKQGYYNAPVFWIPPFFQQNSELGKNLKSHFPPLQQQQQQVKQKKQQEGQSQPKLQSTTTTAQTTTDHALATAMDHVVRLLLPKDRAEEYIQQYPAKEFRFYVYDSLPSKYSWPALAQCIEETFNVPDWFGARTDGNATSNCDWGQSICSQTVSSSSKYSPRRFNRNGDLVLSKLFSEYNGTLRTYDPFQADLFVVPYASSAHCMCENPKISRCHRVKDRIIQQYILANLKYLNETTWPKHLFFNSAQRDIANQYVRNTFPLQATLEPRETNCFANATTCGQIAMPYVNTNRDYQPNSDLVGKSRVKRVQDRKYALASVMSLPKGLHDRGEFQMLMEQLYNAATTQQRASSKRTNETTFLLAGRPVFVSTITGNSRSFEHKESAIMELYQNSIFCPCLPGDTPNQKRFYDSWMSGCIPVVLQHDISHEPGYYPSWYRAGGTSIRLVHPFAKGVFAGEPFNTIMGLDYSQMVVPINGTCGIFKCLIPTLQDWLDHRMDQLQQIQNNIARVSRLFSYGMEDNALQYPDAVAGILVQSRHHVQQLSMSSSTTTTSVGRQDTEEGESRP